MSDVLDYGRRRRSRRHWWVVAVAVVLAGGALVGVRARLEHLARLDADRRLQLQQRALRLQFDRELQKSLAPAPRPAATQP
jgi:hypothetical protein